MSGPCVFIGQRREFVCTRSAFRDAGMYITEVVCPNDYHVPFLLETRERPPPECVTAKHLLIYAQKTGEKETKINSTPICDRTTRMRVSLCV